MLERSVSDIPQWLIFGTIFGGGAVFGFLIAFLVACFDKSIALIKDDQIVVSKERYEQLSKFFEKLANKIPEYDLEFD
jgi:hypothetical protein